jgi:hypothetical protein
MLSRPRFSIVSLLVPVVAIVSVRASLAVETAGNAPAAAQPPAAEQPGNTLAELRSQAYQDYAARLDRLATWCDEQGLADEAVKVRAWLPERKADRLTLFVPSEFRASKPSAPAAQTDSADDKKTAQLRAEFAERFTALRREQAVALEKLAQRAAAEQQGSLAVQLTTEVAREDAGHENAWHFWGYTKHEGAWRTPFEIEQLKAGRVWHEQFGWLPKSYVTPYENGRRFYRGRWMPEGEEAALRAKARDPWRIETDHYAVTSHRGLEQGVALAEQLERLRAVWLQVFPAYLVDEADLARLLSAGKPLVDPAAPRHNVVYYRSREQYNDELRPQQSQIEITLGFYLASNRTAYFFAGPEQEPGTVDHEATHQLFHESRPVAKNVGARENYWIVEAVACYMQSLVRHDGYFTLGGADAGRMPVARKRRLTDGVYVPLAEVVRLGMRDLQLHPDIIRLYTQFAGLAAFLLDRYPEATAEYLEAVYTDRADSATLSRLTGVGYEQLDREYTAYLEGLTP